MELNKKLLRLTDVIEITSLSKSTIYRREKTGSSPKRFALGGNCVVWKSIEIDRWMKNLSPVGGWDMTYQPKNHVLQTPPIHPSSDSDYIKQQRDRFERRASFTKDLCALFREFDDLDRSEIAGSFGRTLQHVYPKHLSS